MKPHIAVVNPQFFVNGGAERQIAQLCNYLTDQNYRVTIITAGAIQEFKSSLKETRIFEVGNLAQVDGYTKNMSHKFSLINTHNHPAELFPIPIKVKHVWQCNEPPVEALRGDSIDPLQVKTVNKFVNRAVVITDYDKERFKKLYGMDATVIYPGVRGEYFSQPISKPNDKWRLNGKFVLLQMGYVTWTKNQVRSVEILAETKKMIDDTVLVIGGFDKDANYRQQIMNKAIELGVEDDVIITGYLNTDEEVRDLYHLANVHIMPCLDQGGWATTLEGICAGLPTITSDKFVAANLIKDHMLGGVIPIDRMDQWMDAIHAVYESKNREATYNNAKWIRDNLTWNKYGEQYCKVFDEVLNE